MSGWRYDEQKNENRKLSPHLVEWEDLDDAIREYDRDAVREIPGLLKKLSALHA